LTATIPVSQATGASAAASSDSNDETILVADDDRTTRAILVRVLEELGFRTIPASDGEEAVRLFFETEPDIVLLDVMMPKKSGYEACREIRSGARHPDTPILFLSARDSAEDRVEGLELGAVDYITKPFDKAEVLARVRIQLRLLRLTRSLQEANARLLASHRQNENDLEAAEQIQRSLTLTASPPIPGVSTAWTFLPNERVGGDMFDIIRIDPRYWAVFMVDVSGHGVPAALVTVSVSQSLTSSGCEITTRRSPEPPFFQVRAPSEVLQELAREYPFDRFEKFFTISYLLYDTVERSLWYSGAGHPSPILLRADGSIEKLSAGGLLIGLGDVLPFEEGRVALGEGDRLFVYTDGILESRNERGEFYGEDRLDREIVATRSLAICDACARISDRAIAFAGQEPQADDISLLCVEFGRASRLGNTRPQSTPTFLAGEADPPLHRLYGDLAGGGRPLSSAPDRRPEFP